MDLLPLIPEGVSPQDISQTLRKCFQETLTEERYSEDVAENIIRGVNTFGEFDDDMGIIRSAVEVLQIHRKFNLCGLNYAIRTLLKQHGKYLIEKERIGCQAELTEGIKLKHCDFFEKLPRYLAVRYGLIQSDDLLPDIIQRYLDFRYKEYKKSGECRKSKRSDRREALRKTTIDARIVRKRKEQIEKIKPPIELFPKAIIFKDCEQGRTYQPDPPIHLHKEFTEKSCFQVNFDANSKIAPGICAAVKITFRQHLNLAVSDSITFRTKEGYAISVPVKYERKDPELITCIFKSNTDLSGVSIPGSVNFSEDRREALNSSVDCGSCFVGQCVLISIIAQNKGSKGKFFIISEDDWYFMNVDDISASLELVDHGFWIYPIFFELDSDKLTEINVIFQPTKVGLHLDMLYMICDNNTYSQMEVMGEGLKFRRSMVKIDIPSNDTDIAEKENYCVYFGNVIKGISIRFVVRVHNTCSVYLDCSWNYRNKAKYPKIYDIEPHWITQSNCIEQLPPYSTADFIFDLNFDANISGYHSAFFSFAILNLPQMALEEDEEFKIRDNCESRETTLAPAVDVQIAEFEVACFIDLPQTEGTKGSELSQSDKLKDPSKPAAEPYEPRLAFTPKILNFGTVPVGITLTKPLRILSLSDDVEWSIYEVRYDIDSSFVNTACEGNVSPAVGRLQRNKQEVEIFYQVNAKRPIQWVSVLCLVNQTDPLRVEDICVVTYEVIQFDIVVHTGHTDSPILCPLKIIYVGMPVDIEFTVENRSPIEGCFCFMKPYGRDSDKMSVTFQPQSAVLKAGKAQNVVAKLTCNEIGTYEHFYVPCFIGVMQEPIAVTVICAADGLRVFFYLPLEDGSFKKVMWPPKIVYEYEPEYFVPCLCEQECTFEDFRESTTSSEPTQRVTFKQSLKVDSSGSSDDKSSIYSNKQGAALADVLQKRFGEEFVQRADVVEVHKLPVRVPSKLSFFIENITPIKAGFSVRVQNYVSNDEARASTFTFKRKADIWNSLVNPAFGILVHPETETGDISGYGSVKINIWIFANTWGIYQEEITVDIEGCICFGFSLLIEAIGSPVTFPIAMNSIAGHPILRPGNLPYKSHQVKKSFKLINQSSIPLHIVWSTYLAKPISESKEGLSIMLQLPDEQLDVCAQLTILDENVGVPAIGFCEVIPGEVDVPEQSAIYVEVLVKPEYFPKKTTKTDIVCYVLGHIYLEEQFRATAQDTDALKVEIQTALEKPVLTLDSCCSTTKLSVHANDLIFNSNHERSLMLTFFNGTDTAADVTVAVKDPFSLKGCRGCLQMDHYIAARQYLEVSVFFNFDYPEVLKLSERLYDPDYVDDNNFNCYAELDDKILNIPSEFSITHQEEITMIVPIELCIRFPKITVKPGHVNFNSVFLGSTDKTFISIYNTTACKVKFEVYKSNLSDNFFITPHYGEIEESVGMNDSFVNIFIYFTPSCCETYQASIRIVTNIPQYYLEIPVSGNGTTNEKFLKDYKI